MPSCGNQHKSYGNEIMPALFKEPWKPKSQSQRLLINLHPVIVGCCWPNSKKLLLLSTYDESLPSAQEKVLSFLISCKKKSKNQIRSLLEGLKQFSPRQKVFRCREGSMDLLLDPLAVQKPCIQERSAAFRNFDSGDFGQIQGNHLDSLG